ncbi:MAG: hypothetical protein V5B39_13120, partial [Accumulibacter sp.]|uniref:hypothetical protein n=1 Tax=Accumulibacter sp. TaxID=2053492 RepID=UPI002FC28A82
RLSAGFTNRENEDPDELPVTEHHGQQPDTLTRPQQARPAASALSRLRPSTACQPIATEHCTTLALLPATRDPDQATASPIGRQCAASSSAWHRLPAIATKHCTTLALLTATRDPDQQTTASPIGRQCAASSSTWHHLPADRHRAPPDTDHASGNRCLPATRDSDQATASPTGRQCAASSSTWHRLPADRHQAPPDTGAVVASRQASPIERTKTRTNCR